MFISLRRRFTLFILLSLPFGVEYFGYDSCHIKSLQLLPSLLGVHENGASYWLSSIQNEGNATLFAKAPRYVKAIMNPRDGSFPRLSCPKMNEDRYAYLRTRTVSDQGPHKFFFALTLHQCAELLPRLLGSIVEVARFLGPQNCALSIVELESADGTFEILETLRKDLDDLGLLYYLSANESLPNYPKGNTDVLEGFPEPRNNALSPLIDHKNQFDENSTVISLSAVSACPDDILELIHQRFLQNADMTCAMDWIGTLWWDPVFHDVFVARGMTGECFYWIPDTGGRDFASKLFWNDPESRSRLNATLPFQVFSCWNGAVAFTAKPIMSRRIRFRTRYEGECLLTGAKELFCKDMWDSGYDRIAVVPSVNLEYSDEAARKIKDVKGYVQQWTSNEGHDVKIDWKQDPPETVRCIFTYDQQEMMPWDAGLAGRVENSG